VTVTIEHYLVLSAILFIIGAYGHIFVIMSITVAAAEVAVGLAFVVTIYTHHETLNIDVLKMLKG